VRLVSMCGKDADSLTRALFAWNSAPRLCGDAIGPYEECSAYHRIGPLLRCLGLRSQPSDQLDFFRSEIGAAFADGARRVLVSGAIDEAMPALVAEIGAQAGIVPRITVLDRCRTPLALVEAFARDEGADMTTMQADMLAYDRADHYDLIVTHSFVQHFSPEGRRRLFAIWHRLLRPGGLVVTVSRIKPGGETPGAAGTGDGRRDLAGEAVKRLARLPAAAATEPGELRAAIALHTAQRTRFPIRSLGSLVAEIGALPFRVRRAEVLRRPPRVSGVEGPSLPSGAPYAAVAAAAE
jgi:SAM-dependent methyltransferase